MILVRRLPIVIAAILLGYLLLAAAFKVGYVSVAGADETPVLVDAGASSGSATPSPTTEPSPADKLHNPVTDPLAAFDDVRAAKKIGWPLALLAGLIMLARGLGAAGERWPKFKSLVKLGGMVGTIVAGIGTCGAAAFNTLALGGTWFAVAAAAVGAFFTLIHPNPKPPAT